MQTFHLTQKRAFKVNNFLKLIEKCQSTIPNEKLSINNDTNYSKRNTNCFTKTSVCKPTFQILK